MTLNDVMTTIDHYKYICVISPNLAAIGVNFNDGDTETGWLSKILSKL